MTPDLSEDLKQVIDQYLDGHRSRSLATLSRVSGVAYTTLRRFAQREGNPTAEPVLKILEATLGTSEKIAFLERHFPEIARSIKRYAKRAPKDETPQDEAVKVFLRRYPHNVIVHLALAVNNTTRDTISRLCGERGLEALDELLEHEFLEHDPKTGRISYKSETFVSIDADYLLNQIKHGIEHFDQSLIGTPAARASHGSAGVNLAGLKRIHEILSEAVREIVAIHEDERYWGDIPYYFGVIMNVFDKKPFLASKEKDQ